MRQYTWETCSKVIQSEVKTVQSELQRLLGERLLGVYLHGSLALGGFQPTRSDIDMVVVTEQGLDLEMKRTVMTLLLRLSRMPSPLDVRFLIESALFPFQQPLTCELHYTEARREQYADELRNDTWKHWNEGIQYEPLLPIVLAVLQQQGICLSGKPIVEAFPVVPEAVIREAFVKQVQEALNHPLHDLISCVLNACCVLAYLQNGVIISKDAGGTWGLTHLPEQYHPLIEQAHVLLQGERPGRPVGPAAVDDFVRYVREVIPYLR